MLDGSHFFECKCSSDEHTLRFTIDNEDDEMYTSIFLNQYRRWWETVWVGIKYIFGYKCIYGHWDCTLLSIDDVVRLRNLCDDLIKQHEEKINGQEKKDHAAPAGNN